MFVHLYPFNNVLELGGERGDGVRGVIWGIGVEKYYFHWRKTDRKPTVVLVCR